jgi:PPOX class probable F420-dependent enzyme
LFALRGSDFNEGVLSPAAEALIDGANFAHLATLMPDGAPKVEPVWVGRDGHLLLIATDAGTLKAKNAAGDPRVALSVTAFDNPYEQLLVRGRVVEVRPDDDLRVLDALSRKYLGEPFARRRWSQRIVLAIQPDVARHYTSSLRHPPADRPGASATPEPLRP